MDKKEYSEIERKELSIKDIESELIGIIANYQPRKISISLNKKLGNQEFHKKYDTRFYISKEDYVK